MKNPVLLNKGAWCSSKVGTDRLGRKLRFSAFKKRLETKEHHFSSHKYYYSSPGEAFHLIKKVENGADLEKRAIFKITPLSSKEDYFGSLGEPDWKSSFFPQSIVFCHINVMKTIRMQTDFRKITDASLHGTKDPENAY